MRRFKHFTWHQRLELYKYLYIEKLSKTEIAKRLNHHISNVYREIDRGMCECIDSNYKTINMYSPEIAQKNYKQNRKKCGRKYKLKEGSYSLIVYEKIIIDKDMSPRAGIEYIKKHKIYNFIELISYSSVYRYIYAKRFPHLRMKHLAYYNGRVKYMCIYKQKRASAGTSIEYRDENVLTRQEFGHWEMDSLEGNMLSKKVVLNLTERKTRKCILFIIDKKNSKDVVNCIDSLQNQYKDNFNSIFKSITVDNGPEFSDYEGIEKSLYSDKVRLKVYYCHSHSPHERGSNENLNRMLRRKIKKGSNFDNMSSDEIKKISKWINEYPRKILNWDSAEERFQKELKFLIK